MALRTFPIWEISLRNGDKLFPLHNPGETGESGSSHQWETNSFLSDQTIDVDVDGIGSRKLLQDRNLFCNCVRGEGNGEQTVNEVLESNNFMGEGAERRAMD